MNNRTYPKQTLELAEMWRNLGLDTEAAFRRSAKSTFSDGAISSDIKQLVAVAVAHVTQRSYCITGSHQSAAASGSGAPGADGSGLVASRNESRRCVRAFRANADYATTVRILS
jgi:AhpD family alkylhydroperoxidase